MSQRQTTDLVPNIRVEGKAVFAVLSGEIDLHKSPALRTTILELVHKHDPRKLVLDLSAVPYMDSSAIAVLVEALKKMRKSQGKIYLLAPQPRVKGLLEIARLDTVFSIVKGESEVMDKDS
jgi:anti-anti-sigma factor